MRDQGLTLQATKLDSVCIIKSCSKQIDLLLRLKFCSVLPGFEPQVRIHFRNIMSLVKNTRGLIKKGESVTGKGR